MASSSERCVCFLAGALAILPCGVGYEELSGLVKNRAKRISRGGCRLAVIRPTRNSNSLDDALSVFLFPQTAATTIVKAAVYIADETDERLVNDEILLHVCEKIPTLSRSLSLSTFSTKCTTITLLLHPRVLVFPALVFSSWHWHSFRDFLRGC